jgi:hypothetical protein
VAGAEIQTTTTDYYPYILAWYSCGEKLIASTSVPEKERLSLLHDIGLHSVDRSKEFMTLVMAVIAAESSFNKKARSRARAVGLMQLTNIGVREAIAQCEYARIKTKHLYQTRHNIKYGTCLLQYYLNEVNGDTMMALILYNGGYKQLTSFMERGKLVKETADYVIRVNSYLRRCKL